MSEKHKVIPLRAEDLKDLGFGSDNDTPEPDTNAVMKTIVEDHKTPGNLMSFLAILGYQRGTRKELREFKHWIGLRFAFAIGFSVAVTIGVEAYRLLHK